MYLLNENFIRVMTTTKNALFNPTSTNKNKIIISRSGRIFSWFIEFWFIGCHELSFMCSLRNFGLIAHWTRYSVRTSSRRRFHINQIIYFNCEKHFTYHQMCSQYFVSSSESSFYCSSQMTRDLFVCLNAIWSSRENFNKVIISIYNLILHYENDLLWCYLHFVFSILQFTSSRSENIYSEIFNFTYIKRSKILLCDKISDSTNWGRQPADKTLLLNKSLLNRQTGSFCCKFSQQFNLKQQQ